MSEPALEQITLPVTYIKVELLNIDGSPLGFARIPIRPRLVRESLGATFGVGYDQRIVLPAGELGDPRCPYMLKVTGE